MIKEIIIHDKNRVKINEILAAEQKRARERKIESYDELIDLIDKYTKKIDMPKKYWEGCKLYIKVGAGHFANKYNGIPQGTCVTIVFRKDGKGILSDVYRDTVKDEKPYCFTMTDIAKKYVLFSMNIF